MSLSDGGRDHGTPAYMAPEQIEGCPITPATDIYALGIVLYEMVTGARPFVGETPLKTAFKRLHEPPPSPRAHVPDVAPRWEATILRCLGRRPEDRFASAGEVVAALEGAPPSANAAPAPTPTPSRRDSETPPVRRSGGEAERRQLTVLVCGCEVFESDAYLELDSEDQARVLRSFQERCEGAVRAVRRHGRAVHRQGAAGVLRLPGRVRGRRRPRRPGRPRAILDAMKLSLSRRTAATRRSWIRGSVFTPEQRSSSPKRAPCRWWAMHGTWPSVSKTWPSPVNCLTEASHRLFQGRFHCVSLGRQKIRSVTNPVELFRIEHIAAAGSPIDAVTPAELSPLTGRDQEIGLLMNRWEQAREGMGQVVQLSGEPGLGKSRLVHTMKHHVLGQMIEGEVDPPSSSGAARRIFRIPDSTRRSTSSSVPSPSIARSRQKPG